VVPQLEHSRAEEEANVDQVISTSDFTEGESRNNENATLKILEELLEKFKIEKVAVPEDFNLKLADELRQTGLEINSVEDKVMESRKTKSCKEVEKLREAQQITEEAMEKAENIISSAEVKENRLYYEGEVLTSERLKKEIKYFLIKNDCELPQETIVASGEESAKPHSTGSGPINPKEPIVIDIFPRHRNKYFGDMTRTFLKGEVSEEIKKMKKAVLEAQKAAFEVLNKGSGTAASEVHNAVCDILESHSFNTLRNGDAKTGFIHSTGHAVGLELHEPPRIAENEDELKSGMTLTIEPSLYNPEIGGIRIEDMVLIKKDGYENFNSVDKGLEVD